MHTIGKRLQAIFPEGIEHRNYLIREIAAKTIFVMFYVGAVEGYGAWIRPNQVTKMTDRQAARTSEQQRMQWASESLRPGKMKDIPGRWYATDTREPIRDETLRIGLVGVGAVIERPGLKTTSAKPRYALASDFATLFTTDVSEADAEVRIAAWQGKHLSPSALKRMKIVRSSRGCNQSG